MFLEFYVFGERVIVGVRGGGGVRNISSPLRGGIKYFPTLLGGLPNFMVEFWNTLHHTPPPTPEHILYDRSLNKRTYGSK